MSEVSQCHKHDNVMAVVPLYTQVDKFNDNTYIIIHDINTNGNGTALYFHTMLSQISMLRYAKPELVVMAWTTWHD